MKVVQWLERNYRVQVLSYKTILSTQFFEKWRPICQRMLRQQSQHLAQILTTSLPSFPFAHRFSYLFQTLYSSSRLNCRRQQTIRPLSTMHGVLKTDRAPHTRVSSASSMSNRRLFLVSEMSRQYYTALEKHLQIGLFNSTSNPVSVHCTATQRLAKKKYCPGEQTDSLFLTAGCGGMRLTWFKRHSLRWSKPVPRYILI